ncbi:protein FAM184B isoform X2 [Caloenas nicobarica]|uniref:protein FAM184B isoform X2 n=1 Tax=Caloenas nicobarica TaxID=187106 RepID=UPI0032B74849
MASGINKIHQPGICNGSGAARSSSAEECNQEMHMKMCKKIAQLTKVIYALNIKNDEHEAVMQALREAHEEEIQHILAETRETIIQCKSKAEEELLLRKRIQALEIAVEQHKRLKEEALAELTLCKKQVEERELTTEAKQAQTGLSTDTVDTNADFENKLLHLNQESDGLLNKCKASRRENLDKRVILDEKYSLEGQALLNEMENLKRENQRATEEYTQKTSKLQASYEREKEDLKNAMQQTVIETKNNSQQREMEQRKSSEAEKIVLLHQVKKLEADLEEKSQKINERKKHSQKLKERIQELQTQLEEFKRKSECELKQLEKEKEVLTGKLQNSSLEEAEERLKKEFNETFKIQHQSHRLEIQTLEEKAKKELHDELKQIQKQQTLLLGSLRMELSEQQTSCTNLKKQIEELQAELRSVRTLKKQQEGSSQSQIRSLHDELEKCQSEISELKKENLLLKDTMELLSAELESQKQEAAQLQDREKQHRRLKESEEKSRKWESKSEDTHLISSLQDKLSEREEIIKQLTEGRKFQHSLLANTESYRNRSFSFNPGTGYLTPSMKQKKKMVEAPSRVVSVPNLASYAKSFLSCDLRSKRSAPQITKSTSLDRSPGCLRVGSPSAQSSDTNAATRTHGNEPPQTKDDQNQDPQHQEWFTKYFSF